MGEPRPEGAPRASALLAKEAAPARPTPPSAPPAAEPPARESLLEWLKGLRRGRDGEASVRETLDELISEREETAAPIGEDERRLLANILDLRSRTVYDVMVPRARIVAIDVGTTLSEVIDVITKTGHSRLPVYRESLDDAIGMIHIKDVLAWRGRDPEFALAKILRKVLFVSPSMQVLELLLEMRVKRIHMALVVDEFGGVDGLVTIEDLVEEIVGEIGDEHDRGEAPALVRNADGTFDADARVAIEDLEERIGPLVSDEAREEIDTLGGLVSAVAGRVPIRGELIRHATGLEFEVLDADPRRVKRLRVRPRPPSGSKPT